MPRVGISPAGLYSIALSADRVVIAEKGGTDELLCEFALSGDELVDDLALSQK
ncbi:MAG TPA: hypothetical protein VFO16_20270 [Pseudonocardiaceae bacterium]|nr:hypothetical protein [Pseudonocardiaceae bacterium]